MEVVFSGAAALVVEDCEEVSLKGIGELELEFFLFDVEGGAFLLRSSLPEAAWRQLRILAARSLSS